MMISITVVNHLMCVCAKWHKLQQMGEAERIKDLKMCVFPFSFQNGTAKAASPPVMGLEKSLSELQQLCICRMSHQGKKPVGPPIRFHPYYYYYLVLGNPTM